MPLHLTDRQTKGVGATCFIYTLHSSLDVACKPRYVGFTCNTKIRLYGHNNDKNKSRKARWVKDVRNSGGKIVLTVVFEFICNDLSIRKNVEGHYIQKYRKEFPDLLNDGGAGNGIAPCSERQKEAVRRALTGLKRPPGKKLSQEHKDNISKGNRGKKRSPENAAKCRIARLGIPHSPEIRKKISEAGRGKKRSLTHIQNYRVSWWRRHGL